MTKENVKIALKDMKVVDGKVVISSEELAAAIQDCEVDPNVTEEAEALIVGFFCKG